MTWTYYWAAGGSGAQPRYYQFSYKGCMVGCGPVAWGILLGWADRQAAAGNPQWAPHWGIYRENGGRGANAVAPIYMDTGVQNMIKEINDHVGTFCVPGGQGATFPWRMGDVTRYLTGRATVRPDTHYNVVGYCEDRLRNYARDSIKNRATPAVIGTGWLQHYPVAFGYAEQRRIVRRCFIFCWDDVVYDRYFYVNQGGGSSSYDMIPASTWFAGEIYPS